MPEEALHFLWRTRGRLDPVLADVVSRVQAFKDGLVDEMDLTWVEAQEGAQYMIEALDQARAGTHDVAVAHNAWGWPVAALSFGRRPGWIVVGRFGSAPVRTGAGPGREVELAIIASSEDRGVVTDDISNSNESGDIDDVDPGALRVLERLAGR